MLDGASVTTVGVDGCKGGWIAVWPAPDGHAVGVFATFAQLVGHFADGVILAVDMPIGLPDFTRHGGRGPEALVRRNLGERQSSVFSIPSRAAVHAEPGPFSSTEDYYLAHKRACEVAQQTSDPPRGVSIQAFGLFPKIREIDALLIGRPDLRRNVFESHPEVAFCRLNGDKPMRLPKKVKGAVNLPGMAERRELLLRHGFDSAFLEMPPPNGAAADDFLDACVMSAVAARIAAGEATSFPDPPASDSLGIPVAIWA